LKAAASDWSAGFQPAKFRGECGPAGSQRSLL